MKKILICGCFLVSSLIEAISVTQVSTKYEVFCESASKKKQIFQKFRGEGPCLEMVENVSLEQGTQILSYLMSKYPSIIHQSHQIILDDKFGSPVQYPFPGIGMISPTTIRYLKIAGDLESIFGSLKNFQILEIGGGYGGQCKILHDLFGFSRYTIIDLEKCILLIGKYLNHFNVPCFKCIPSVSKDQEINYDLVISNYAFSEIDKTEQIEYVNRIIKHIPRGYITYNNVSEFHNLLSLTIDEFVSMITDEKREVLVLPETPLTGDNNCLIFWRPK